MDEKEKQLEEHKVKVAKNRSFVKPKIWKLTTVVLLLLILFMVYTDNWSPTAGVILEESAAAERAVSYINNNLLAGLATAEIVQVKAIDGIYQLDLHITYTNGLEEDFTSYMSTSGNILFPTALDISGYSVEEQDSLEAFVADIDKELLT
tara:strand:+ start:2897 stop:3346 length:450 start_codon:yes stop_codon:yes gene_type:complete